MRYLITGASGQLGMDLKEALEKEKDSVVFAYGKEELDIRNREEVRERIEEDKPDVIFHCAAYTKVDQAEIDHDLCMEINVDGTKNVVDAARMVDAKLVFFSSDYVFDGEKDGFYQIDDKTNPKSVYGKSKEEGEKIVSDYPKHFIVRISWVFGKHGNNFVKTMLRLGDTKRELNVVDDQIGSPTYTKDLAPLLLKLVKKDSYGIYHMTNEGVCSFYEFACEILKEKDVLIHPVTTEEYKKIIGTTYANRPKNSKLDKSKLKEMGLSLPTWQDALERFKKDCA